MYCRVCGNEVPAQAVACVKCGFSPYNGQAFCGNCAAPTQPGQMVCVKCGVPLTSAVYGRPAIPGAKSRLAAGLLGIFLGGFGVHRFYLGYTSLGIVEIIVTVCTCGIRHFWGFIEGILILAGSTITTDADGRPLTD